MMNATATDGPHRLARALQNVAGLGVARPGGPREQRLAVPAGRLLDVASTLHQLAYRPRLFTMVAADERAQSGGFTLATVFADDGAGELLTLETPLPAADPAFPSITPVWPSANWSEREVHDLFGIVPIGHPDLRRLVLHGNWPAGVYPLRKDADLSHVLFERPASPSPPLRRMASEGVVDIPVGPIHAGIIEPGHFRFSAIGEVVYHLEARLFYVHRGIEKLCEGRTLEAALPVVERICGACAFSHATAYCRAAEALLGVDVPVRAQRIRLIALELERLYNHIGDLGNLCAGASFAAGASHGARLKEVLMRLNEAATGSRWLRGINRIGGVRRDLTPSAASQIREMLATVEPEFRRLVDLIRGIDSLIERFTGTGRLPAATAVDLGAVGVAARASGFAIDTRRDLPHPGDREALPTIPAARDGDVMARALIRIDETLTSFRLVRHHLDAMPEGRLAGDIPPAPEFSRAIGWAESPRGETVHWVATGAGGRIDRYRIKSAPFANWAVVPAAVPGNMVPDFPLINKSFELCYSCCDR